jgi:predicted CXXCH cytochrome family protein
MHSNRKSGRIPILLALLALVTLVVTPLALRGQATDDIRATKHNFSATRDPAFAPLGVTNYGEVCVYCHTPHGGQTQAPLWNRAFGTGPYQPYSSPTINMTVGMPSGVSLACLSCHDGTIGIDVISNPPNRLNPVPSPTGRRLVDIFTTGLDTFKILGTDLRNDHPVAVTYDPSKDPMFQPQATVEAAGLRFYGAAQNEVTCATCHNPHNKVNVPFLRKDNANSDLCITCHIK